MSREWSAYWRDVWRGAWAPSRELFLWWAPVGISLIAWVITGLLLGWDKAVSAVSDSMIWGAATAIYATAVLLGYLVRSAYLQHIEQLSKIGRLDTRLTSAAEQHATEVARLRDDIARLEGQVARRKKNQSLSDAMRKRHRDGISRMLHRAVLTDADLRQWSEEEREFTLGTLAEMRNLEASDSEIHAVEMIGVFPLGNFSPHELANSAMSMFVQRLDRIAEVATAHDQDKVP